MKTLLMLILFTRVSSVLLVPSQAVGQKEEDCSSSQFFDVNVDVHLVTGNISTFGKRSENECQAVIIPEQVFIVSRLSRNDSSKYVIGLDIKSHNLYFTLNVDINAVPNDDSSVTIWDKSYKTIMTVKDGIMWPFKWTTNKMTEVYTGVVNTVEDVNHSVRRKLDNPIELIEMILEVISVPVVPALKGGWWLCESMAQIKRDLRNKTFEFMNDHPTVLQCLQYCQTAKSHVSALVARWPWNWMDSIEIIGYSWVILYFSYALIRFAEMDERQLRRDSRHHANRPTMQMVVYSVERNDGNSKHNTKQLRKY